MLLNNLLLWIVLFIYLAPILLIGIIIFRKILFLDRWELLIPAGSIFGITLFVFFINIISFFVKGAAGVNLSYFFLLLLLLIVYSKGGKQPKIKLTLGKTFIFCLLSALFWGPLIFWKGNFALIGSDTNLYYSVAHTFIKGNSPALTPWQPDLSLAYHLGAFQLLGAVYSFTNLSFEFLHILFSAFFIFCSSQIIIWIWKRHDNIMSLLWGNLAAGIVLISFGFLKLAVLILPSQFPQISNLHQFFLWIRNLPTVNQSIEAYGAPVNLDTLIYFIFHAFGLAIFLSLTVIIVYSRKSNFIYRWIILMVGLSTLALVNESVFIISAFSLIVGGIFKEFQSGLLDKRTILVKSIFISIVLIIMCTYVLIQGGTITNSILGQKTLEKSILIFPDGSDKNKDLLTYHRTQTSSRSLAIKEEWLPLRWFHIGCDVLILFCVSALIFIKFSRDQKIVLMTLFLTGISALLAYYYIVPKYLAANGNRFLAFAFMNFSLFIIYSLQNFFETLSKSFLKYFLLGILTLFILIPTVLPPMAMLSKTRFGENRLMPKKEQPTPGVEWIKNNLPYNSKVAVLDVRSSHPSGMARVMVQGGVFAPVFSGKVRVYTIEASPEYFDMVYFLNPQALLELKISFLLIDSSFFGTLPDIRKAQLGNEIYFRKIFENRDNKGDWEKIYEISDKYLKTEGEIGGSFKEFAEILPNGKIYIDNEEHFNPNYLRRAIIFSVRDRDLYYLPQSGVYLNVETDISKNLPRSDSNYDYLILGKDTDPKDICKCQPKLIWKGLKDEIYVWESKLLNQQNKL